MNLPDGIRHAVHMGANEAFLEWLYDPSESYLATLGGSYQGIGSDAVSIHDVQRYVVDLNAWDDGTAAAQPRVKVDSLVYAAGIEFARGLIAAAANIGTVPIRVKPYMSELAPLVHMLETALVRGSFDENDVDFAAIIWGDSDDHDGGDKDDGKDDGES